MDTIDWRAQLQPGIRQRKVNEIVSELERYHPSGDEDESLEVQKIALSLEHKTLAEATSQEDYLEKIYLLILSIDRSCWRAQLAPESRQRIVNKIMDTLRRHLPFSGQDGLVEVCRIAETFEEKIYVAATSQSDYLRKISLRLLAVETRSQHTMSNSMPSNLGDNSSGPSDTVRQSGRKRRQPQWLAEFVTNG